MLSIVVYGRLQGCNVEVDGLRVGSMTTMHEGAGPPQVGCTLGLESSQRRQFFFWVRKQNKVQTVSARNEVGSHL